MRFTFRYLFLGFMYEFLLQVGTDLFGDVLGLRKMEEFSCNWEYYSQKSWNVYEVEKFW